MKVKQLQTEWKEIKFNNLFSFEKKTKRQARDGKENGKYKFFTSSPIQVKFIDHFDFDGERLIFGTGGGASIHYCKDKFSCSADCFVTKSDGSVLTKYVYYYLKTNIQLLEQGFQGAGLKHLSKNYLLKLKIKFPQSKETQREIIHILEKIERLEEKRKEANGLLTQYLKFIFYEMFGRRNKSYNNWQERKIEDLIDKEKGGMRTGPFGSDLLHGEFTQKGVCVLGIDNAVENNFSWKRRRYITREKYEKLKRYTVYPEDVIVTIMATVGRSAVVPKDIPLAINTKHLAAITLNQELANPYFISFALHSHPYILNQIKMANRGAIMEGLNLTIIRQIKLRIPPLKLQQKFASIVEHVERLKEKQKQSLGEIEQLSNALMQKAFRGELVK